MTTFNQSTLATFFQTGDVPTGNDYSNLIYSCVNVVETGVQTLAGAFNPTELISGRVSAGNGVFTGTLSIAGVTSAKTLAIDVSAGLVLTNQGNGAGVGAGTITTAPTAGEPAIWVPVNINGTVRFFPAW